MRQKSQTRQTASDKAIKDIRRATRKQYSAEVNRDGEKPLRQKNTDRTTLILISIYEVSGEGFIGERKSNPLICKSLLVGLLLDNDESKYLTNLWGHQTDKDDLLVSF